MVLVDNHASAPGVAVGVQAAPATVSPGLTSTTRVRCPPHWCTISLSESLACSLGERVRVHPWSPPGHRHLRSTLEVHHEFREARAWAHVIWRCWQDHAPYDPAAHNSLQALLKQRQPTA
jgi:hypothetical protein